MRYRLPRATGWLNSTRWQTVARRNESCEARANEAPAGAAGSRLDWATANHHTSTPPSALLTECFAGALSLTTRYEVAKFNEVGNRSAA